MAVNTVTGWKLPDDERERLLERFQPRYARTIAHHLTLASGAETPHRYTAEFDFRYNTKDISDRERADEALKGIEGKRLTYRRPASLAA